MSTVNDRDFVDKLIARDGWFDEDPRVYQIVEYNTKWGGVAWGITWIKEEEKSKHRYEVETDFVRNPKIIWRADDERYQGSS